MNLSYYKLTIPVIEKNLVNMRSVLLKWWEHAGKNWVSEIDFLNLKLIDDMFPLIKHVQVITDLAKGIPARLTETPQISIADSETSVKELIDRIDLVIKNLENFKPEDFENTANIDIELPLFPNKSQTSHDYLIDFGLANFMFHCSILYALIRIQWSNIWKADFIWELKLKDTK